MDRQLFLACHQQGAGSVDLVDLVDSDQSSGHGAVGT